MRTTIDEQLKPLIALLAFWLVLVSCLGCRASNDKKTDEHSLEELARQWLHAAASNDVEAARRCYLGPGDVQWLLGEVRSAGGSLDVERLRRHADAFQADMPGLLQEFRNSGERIGIDLSKPFNARIVHVQLKKPLKFEDGLEVCDMAYVTIRVQGRMYELHLDDCVRTHRGWVMLDTPSLWRRGTSTTRIGRQAAPLRRLKERDIEHPLKTEPGRKVRDLRAAAEALQNAKAMYQDAAVKDGNLYKSIKYFRLHLAYKRGPFDTVEDERLYQDAVEKLIEQVKEKYRNALIFEKNNQWEQAMLLFEELLRMVPAKSEPEPEESNLLFDNVVAHLVFVRQKIREA